MLYDYREKDSNEISDVDSKPTVEDYVTVEVVMQTSLKNVMNRLASFLDQHLVD